MSCQRIKALIIHIYEETAEMPYAIEVPEQQEVIMVQWIKCKLRCVRCGHVWVEKIPFRQLT